MKKAITQSRDHLLLTLIAIPIGIAAGLIDALFGRVLIRITDIRVASPTLFIPFLGVIGVVIQWGYRKFGKESIKGMRLLFEVKNGDGDHIPLRLIPLTIVGTWLTHLFGGSAGREGVAVQIGGALGHTVSKFIRVQNGEKILLITGMAAGFGGLFRTPFAAAFFAIEVFTVGYLEHIAVLPALAGALTASYVSGACGLEKFSIPLAVDGSLSWNLLPQLILLGILFGLIGRLFSVAIHHSKTLFGKLKINPYLRIFIAGTLIGVLSLLFFKGRYSGLGTNLISMSFADAIKPWDFALKFIFTILTLSAGFPGGEVTPLFSIGAALGAALALMLGLSVPLTAALGYASVFGSATNTMIAPILIGVEVFGTETMPLFVIVCLIAYALNGNRSIYPQKIIEDLSNPS